MAQTIQPVSHALVETAKTEYTTPSLFSVNAEEPEPEDTLNIMLSLCDSANNICITLEKIYHVLKMKNLEMRIRAKYKEEGK